MTLAVRVIPCLDVANGRVVKGVNFENLRDAGDPVELARRYFEQGADELTFLDVSATVDNRATTYDVVRATAEQVFIPLTVGGGIRSVEDVAKLQAAFDNVFQTMDAIDTFRSQANKNMEGTVQALETGLERARPYLDRVRQQEGN